MNFRNKLFNLLCGRNGMDSLGKAMIVLMIVVAIVRMFIRNLLAYRIISILWVLIFAVIIFRCFSKNIYARQKENAVYEKLAAPVRPKIGMLKNRIRDIKYKRYRTCPNCKAVSRLPIKRGRHNVRCPKCRMEFKVFILF
ncbi:MAG: hypothetical protein KBS52_05565 [Clostridiales bacterium]|nr:hypothetical protein [Candidatus Equinaster intestinalis]